jgi:Family of unknown function (DUF6512)
MRKLVIWEIAGALIIVVAGTLLHSAYHNMNYWLLALISPVNESVWEHLKIGIWPVLFFAVIEYPFIKSYTKNFLEAKVAQAYTTAAATLIIFYSYTYFLGYNLLPLDIMTFILAVFIGQLVSYLLLTANELDEFFGHMALSALYLLAGAIVYATYLPPHYPLFMDTMTGKYGIPEVKKGMLESLLFFSRNTLLTILIVLIVFLIMNITTPFRVWSMNRKMDKIISLLEKIAKK